MTRIAIVVVGVTVAASLLVLPVHAHHAFAAEYDANKRVELKGTVTRLEWTNPHSWLYVDVKDASGQVTKWAIEFGSPFSLMQKGLRKSDFPIGVEVTVKGFLAKSGKSVANASSVALPNGQGFYTGAADSGDATNE
jgi:hypothetical protein